MPIGDPFDTDVPAVGASGTAYASDINDLLDEIVVRLEAEVPVSSIADADAALNMNNQAVQSLSYAGFYEQDAAPSGAPYNRLSVHGDELYYVSAGGVVQITDSGGLNAAALGGFGGDYGSGPESADFVNATETYEFYDDAAQSQWALLKSRGLDVVDEASGYRTRLTSSASIAADQAYALPPADPASGVSVLVINSSGNILLAENAAITNQFTMEPHKHTTEVEQVFGPTETDWWVTTGSAARNTTSAYVTATAPFTAEFLLPKIPVGRRLKSVKVRLLQSAASTATVTVYSITDGGAPSSIGTANTATAGSAVTVTCSVTADTVTFGKIYKVRVAMTGGGSPLTYTVYSLSLSYDYV